MTDARQYSLQEAHEHFAKMINARVHELLQKPDRSRADDELMIDAAHASCYHWQQIGTGVHHQRGEWLIAHVYSELGMKDLALEHAARCLALTKEHAALMKDFDRCYAFEALARANALAGNQDEAHRYARLAQETGTAILNEEDKNTFLEDFKNGNWHGLK